MAGYISRWFTCPQAVAHRSTNPARHRVTSLIESNALPPSHATNPKAEKKQKKAEEVAASARRQAQKDLEEGLKQIVSLEDSPKKAKTEQHSKEKLADSLLREAENKLKKAVQTGDVTDINIAQTLLETAQLKRAKEIETAKATNDMQKRVDKHKATLLEHFAKKPKTD